MCIRDRLRQAGLASVRRDGRSLIYTADYAAMAALMAYLTENCCRGEDEGDAAACAAMPRDATHPATPERRPHA